MRRGINASWIANAATSCIGPMAITTCAGTQTQIALREAQCHSVLVAISVNPRQSMTWIGGIKNKATKRHGLTVSLGGAAVSPAQARDLVSFYRWRIFRLTHCAPSDDVTLRNVSLLAVRNFCNSHTCTTQNALVLSNVSLGKL